MKDQACKFAELEIALKKYQDPREVDKMMAIQGKLDETKAVLVRVFNALLPSCLYLSLHLGSIKQLIPYLSEGCSWMI